MQSGGRSPSFISWALTEVWLDSEWDRQSKEDVNDPAGTILSSKFKRTRWTAFERIWYEVQGQKQRDHLQSKWKSERQWWLEIKENEWVGSGKIWGKGWPGMYIWNRYTYWNMKGMPKLSYDWAYRDGFVFAQCSDELLKTSDCSHCCPHGEIERILTSEKGVEGGPWTCFKLFHSGMPR